MTALAIDVWAAVPWPWLPVTFVAGFFSGGLLGRAYDNWKGQP